MTSTGTARRSPTTIVLLIVGTLALTATIATTIARWPGDSPSVVRPTTPRHDPGDLEFVIPAGTAERVRRGARVDILPSPLRVKVGDAITIRNRDREAVALGPFFVGARQTLTQEFVAPGRLNGNCAVHASGRLVIKVAPR